MNQILGTLLRSVKIQYQNNVFLHRLSSVLAIDMLVKLSGFLLIPVFLRLMNQEEYGMYNYILSILATFSLVLNFGLYMPIAKLYHSSTNTADKGELLFSVYATLVLLLLAVLVPLYAFRIDYLLIDLLFKNQFDYEKYRFTILIALCITIFSFMLTNYFFSTEKIATVKKYNLARIILVNLVVLPGLYFTAGDIVDIRLKLTYFVELLLFAVFLAFLVKEMKPVFKKAISTQALAMGWPIMLSALLGIVINFSDKFFLEKFGGFTELSNYYLAVSFASILTVVVGSIQNAWLPLFLKEKNLEINILKTKKLVKQLLIVFTGLSVAIYVLFYLLLVLDVIPGKYSLVLRILPILLATQIFSSLSPFLINYLVYFQKTYLVSLAGIIVCLISLGASLLLVPTWGIYGAASAALVSNLAYLLIYYFLVKRIIASHSLTNI
ncbi:lipopolysaccharide biosynthesis protein [Flavitalea antarctica]